MKTLAPKRPAALAIVSFLFLAASPALAQTTPTAQDCLAAQVRASAVDCAAVAKCYGKAMRTGTAVSPACLSLARGALVSSAALVEGLGKCLVTGAAGSVGDTIALGEDDLATSLTLTGGHCASIKIGALGKLCSGFLRCNASADATSTPLDPACIASRAAKLNKLFPKLDAQGKCATTGDLATLEGKVARLVDSIQLMFRGTGTTTTSSTATTL